jgi:hypothetical protein
VPNSEIASADKKHEVLRASTAGVIGVVGGLLWLGALLAEYRFDLFTPRLDAPHVADQLAFVLAMICYVVALLGLRSSDAAGHSRFARTIVAIWAAGWVLVAIGAVTSLIAPTFKPAEVLPAVGGLLTCISGLVTGILIARAGVWQGWLRWVPLVIALYVLLVLFAPLIAGAEPSLPTEAGWAIGYAVLGAALWRATRAGSN